MRGAQLALALAALLGGCAVAEDPFGAQRDASVGDGDGDGDGDADASTGADAAPEFSALVINEFVFNHTGTDTHEFVEVAGPAMTNHGSATLVLIDGDALNAGLILFTQPVGTTDAAGYWASAFFENGLENGSETLLLVDGFTGAVDDDIDSNDDGVFDAEPWTSVLDSVSVLDGDAGDVSYLAPALLPDHGGGSFPVAGASRMPNGSDSDQASDWVRNDFDGTGLACCAGATADPGEALNTPGAANQVQN